MSSLRALGRTVAALLVAVAVSLLGFRLFLPGIASACAPSGAHCCCGPEAAKDDAAPASKGCGCSISPATPIPAAAIASADALPLPALAGEAPDALPAGGSAPVLRPEGPAPRARSAPTQALLTIFRN
jgi:hypothetical protein